MSIIRGLAALAALVLVATPALAGKPTAREVEKALQETVRDVNSRLPRTLSDGTRWDSVSGGNRQFRYHYTIVDRSAAKVNVAALRRENTPWLMAHACGPEMAVFVDAGYSVSYAYYGNDGREITVVTITPGKCRQLR